MVKKKKNEKKLAARRPLPRRRVLAHAPAEPLYEQLLDRVPGAWGGANISLFSLYLSLSLNPLSFSLEVANTKAAFGGGTVTALVIGDRKVAPLAILSSNEIAVFWTVAWWLLNYSPLSSFLLSLLEGLLPLKVASKACVNTLRAQLISARVDFAVGAFPGVVAAPLLLGEFFMLIFSLSSFSSLSLSSLTHLVVNLFLFLRK